MEPFAGLRCGRITLWLIEEANADHVRQMLAEPWIVKEFDRSFLPRFDKDGYRRKWGFYITHDDKLAGLTLLGISYKTQLRAYTGADILEPMRGRGITPASKPCLFYLGFELLGLQRIETGCFVSNASSQRSIEKTPGFVYEGIGREAVRNDDGVFEDERRYAIIRRDWETLYKDFEVEVIPLSDTQ